MRRNSLIQFVVLSGIIILIFNPLVSISGDEQQTEGAYQSIDSGVIPENISRADLIFIGEMIQQRLNLTVEYGISVADQSFAEAEQSLTNARKAIEADDTVQGAREMERARRLTEQVMEKALPPFAESKIDEAKKRIKNVEDQFNKKVIAVPHPDEKSRELIPIIKDYLTAGKESLDSATRNFEAKAYSNAITDAEEVVQLSAIIDEQIRGIQGSVEGRDTTSTTVTSSEAEAPDTSSDAVSSEDTTHTETGIATETSQEAESHSASGAASREGNSNTVQESIIDEGNGAADAAVDESTGEMKTYRVRRSECLWCIAGKKEIYGDPREWKRIWRANRKKIRNPDLIYPGQKLIIPPPEKGD